MHGGVTDLDMIKWAHELLAVAFHEAVHGDHASAQLLASRFLAAWHVPT